MNENRCLIMFAKYPEKGKVKSRLRAALSDSIIVRLYRAFIEDLLERFAEGDYAFRILYAPAERGDDFMEAFGAMYSYRPQTGADLGERMGNALRQCFSEGLQSCVLIGSDSPDLPKAIVREAFRALDTRGAVIGPSRDGGYYLVGFSREAFTPAIFEGIEWSTGEVFEETLRKLKSEGIRVHRLPVWRDIDRPEDLASLIEDSQRTGFAGSRTISVLREQGFIKGS